MKKINRYVCQSCNKKIFTELMEPGTTPFMISCPDCKGDMYSSFFDCNQTATPDMFWFKPTATQIKNQTQWELEFLGAVDLMDFKSAMDAQQRHVDNGGLVLGPDKETINRWKMID